MFLDNEIAHCLVSSYVYCGHSVDTIRYIYLCSKADDISSLV